jgi:protein-S-isoprenylcysteine O-methyltransferase Ste14
MPLRGGSLCWADLAERGVTFGNLFSTPSLANSFHGRKWLLPMSTEAVREVAGIAIPRQERAQSAESLFGRMWLAIPEWLVQFVGASVMFFWLAIELPPYFRGFWTIGAYYQFADGSRIDLPWTRVLVDLNILLIGLAFVCRRPAKTRATRAADVILGLLGGWWPMLPFIAAGVIAWFDPFAAAEWKLFVQSPRIGFVALVTGASLIIVGNLIDVSGYSTLFRSFSVVPEARELKTTGLYRFVRHPVYFGQLISQAGVWFCFAPAHWFWWSFYAVFVALQLWRSKREDAVLLAAFGEPCREWQQRTFWFV